MQTQPRLNQNGLSIDWDPTKKKEVEEAKVYFRRAKYYEKRAVVNEKGEPLEHFHPDIGHFRVLPTQLTKGQLAIRIHDETGDQRLIWDSTDPDEVKEAAERFNKLIEKGWKAYAILPDGSKGRRIWGFDAQHEEVYFDEKKEKLSSKLKKFVEDFGEIVMLPKTYPG